MKWMATALSAVVLTMAGCADRDIPSLADGRVGLVPGGLNFKRVALHGDSELLAQIQNIGRAPVAVEDIAIDGPSGTYTAQFVDPGEHHVVLPGDSAKVNIAFLPLQAGELAGSFVV